MRDVRFFLPMPISKVSLGYFLASLQCQRDTYLVLGDSSSWGRKSMKVKCLASEGLRVYATVYNSHGGGGGGAERRWAPLVFSEAIETTLNCKVLSYSLLDKSYFGSLSVTFFNSSKRR